MVALALAAAAASAAKPLHPTGWILALATAGRLGANRAARRVAGWHHAGTQAPMPGCDCSICMGGCGRHSGGVRPIMRMRRHHAFQRVEGCGNGRPGLDSCCQLVRGSGIMLWKPATPLHLRQMPRRAAVL